MRHPDWIFDLLASAVIDPSDTLLVTGFWRSGTTWLQQTLSRLQRARSVFEPLHPSLETYKYAVRNLNLPQYPALDLNQYMPYRGRGKLEESSDLRTHIHRGLVGALPGLHVRIARHGEQSQTRIGGVVERMRDSFQHKIVTKMVRGHFLIPEVQRLFDPVIIHIRRDPRAVIASMKRQGWFQEWASSLSLKEQLIRPGDGREEFLESWHEEIRRADQKSISARWAAYWAVVEHFVDELSTHPRRECLRYEQLVRCQEGYLGEKIRPFVRQKPERRHLQGASPTTTEDRRNSPEEARLHGWKENLTPGQIEEIESVVATFEMEDRLN